MEIDIIDKLCVELDENHRIQRKIKLFLNIRGYLKLNRLTGPYVEFGIYNGEMMYAAWKVLNANGNLTRYIGLDTFSGEPFPKSNADSDDRYKPGEYSVLYDDVFSFLAEYIGAEQLHLVRGDFREHSLIDGTLHSSEKPVLVAIDCNLMSSIASALEYILPRMEHGGILYIDDYFSILRNGTLTIQKVLYDILQSTSLGLVEYNTYPPFGKAFIVVSKGD